MENGFERSLEAAEAGWLLSDQESARRDSDPVVAARDTKEACERDPYWQLSEMKRQLSDMERQPDEKQRQLHEKERQLPDTQRRRNKLGEEYQ